MFDSSTFTQDMLSNPTKLSKVMIDAMEESDTSEVISINDPNNGFVIQLFGSVCLFSKISEKIDYVSSFFYPQRARNAAQLYPHLSEFDYVKLMASPATLPFVFAVRRDWVINNSVFFDSNYNKIEIPATSFITMGGVVYSMYYPIEILVNRNTGSITAFYDTTTDNSLNTLSSNMLLDVQEYTKDGLDWFQIQFNTYQFQRTITTYTVGVEQGFNKTLSYEDQFYAAKVFTKASDGSWTELAYSMSQMYYDYTTPTALLSLLTDQSQINIQIPQIYFNNGQISQTVKIELYSSKGAVNYALSAADVTGLKANFDTTSSIYAAPLTQAPSWMIFPTTLEVEGGSNVMSYAEIREAVVNQRLYDRVAVTTPEITEAGKKAGFNLTRVIDDLTERMYFASNILTDTDGSVIPTFAGNVLISGDSLAGNPSTIVNYTDGYYTILPTTTFKITNNGLTCAPMTDGEVADMSRMTNSQLVAELNKGIYVRQPFHITLLTTPKSPQASVYNLLSPSVTSLAFIAENAHSAPQMSIVSYAVNHLGNGTGGYQILLGVVRSSNITTQDAANFHVYLTCKTKIGSFVYLPAAYVSTDSNGVDTWAINLATTYHITADDYLTAMMVDTSDTLTPAEISLNQTFTALTSFSRTYDETIPADQTLNALLPVSAQSGQVTMAQQEISIAFGQNLSKQVYSGVNTSWGNDVYETASDTIYYSTTAPIFQTTETGVINTRVSSVTNKVEVVILYQPGSIPAAVGDFDIVTTSDTQIPAIGATTTTFQVNDPTGILVGMPARGTNLPINSAVTAINGNAITVSGVIEAVVPKGTVITITNPKDLIRTTIDQPAPGNQLTVASTANIFVGQSVFGFDVPTGAKVASVDGPTTFSLTVPTAAAVTNNTLLTIINTTAYGVVKVAKGDVVTDPSGAPIIIKDAQNQYLIPAILFDGRLFASQDPNDRQIVTTISQKLQNYANQITAIDAGLLEDSEVYYKPSRTMGYATFGVGNNQTITMSLELSFSFMVYVDTAVYNTQSLLDTMSTSIHQIVNAALRQPIVSSSDLANQIKDQLGSNVTAVEAGDISGVPGLRLIALEETDATPSVENLLSLQPDGSITRSPNINITYLPKPDTSLSVATA